MKYFKQNHSLLLNSVILEWAKFLEKINKGLPMLISKIEGHTPKRASLERARKVLSNHFDKCFYCGRSLSQNKRNIHVDHFIPWSYIYEDEMWNLVLSCSECNLRKLGSLPPDDYIQRLLKRDLEYSDKIELLRKSLLKLDSENQYEKAIRKHYRSCKDYGFTVVNVI